MQDWFWTFLSDEGFQPHGFCLLWRPDVFWLHVVADVVTAGSYFSIPVALLYFALRRRDLAYRWIFVLFGAFIVACGTTHLINVWTMWVPDYALAGVAKGVTAGVSLITALALWPMMPTLLRIPSMSQLAAKNAALAAEIAERETAQTALAALNAELEARVSARTAELDAARRLADRLNEAKSEFLATTSHEIRTPLNGVLGMLDLLEHGELNDHQRQLAGAAKGAAHHLLRILNDILDLSRLEAGGVALERTSFDPAALAREVTTLMAERARSGEVQLVCEIDPSTPARIHGDETRIRQVLLNLVSNAVKFADNGHVALTLSACAMECGDIELRAEVRDDGVGISEAAQARLFQRYSQVEGGLASSHGGSGLGLAICKQLVELMDGQIGVESAPGRGSRFWFTARCGADGSSEAPVAVAPMALRSYGQAPLRRRVLVADDDLLSRVFLESVLRREGCDVETVETGALAVEAARMRSFDAILLDMHMPEMGGRDAALKIRSSFGASGAAPILVVSAHALHDDRDRAFAAWADAFVSKPIDARSLLDALASAIARRLPLAEAV